jgi:hypothetical protein
MAFTTADVGIDLLMDVTNGLAEIHDRQGLSEADCSLEEDPHHQGEESPTRA